jgi:hypothetical protein
LLREGCSPYLPNLAIRHLVRAFQRTLSIDVSFCVHSCGSRCPRIRSRDRLRGPGPRFGPSVPGTGLVPPSRFLTAWMVCSARSLAGLLHPAADPEVRRVAGRSRPLRVWCRPFRDASTLRSFLPRSQPSSLPPSGEEPALLPLPTPDRSGDLRSPVRLGLLAESVHVLGRLSGASRLQGLEPLVESASVHRCCHRWARVASLGFSSCSASPLVDCSLHLDRPSRVGPGASCSHSETSAILQGRT